MRSYLVNQFIRRFSDELIALFYRTLLGQAPDDSGHATYTELLVRTGDIAQVIRSLLDSEEFFKHYTKRHAFALVKQIYQGLLDRVPDEAAAVYVARIERDGELAPVLSELAGSEERWRRELRTRASELVEEMYRGLLDRAPDEAAAVYVERIERDGELAPVLSDLARSETLLRHTFSSHAKQLVGIAYRAILYREPDPSGLSTYKKQLQKTQDFESVLKGLRASKELATQVERDWIMIERAGRVNGLGTYALLFLEHLSFLPWVLAVADWIHQHLGYRSLLLVADDHSLVMDSAKYSPSIYEVFRLNEFESIANKIINRPRALVLHAFLKSDERINWIDRYCDADVFLYADGPTNYAGRSYLGIRKKHLLVFGYGQKFETRGHKLRSDLPAVGQVPWKSVFRYYRDIADSIPIVQPADTPPRATVILFMQYWQAEPYRIPEDIVVHALVRFLFEQLDETDVLVIKEDYKCPPAILSDVLTAVRAAGVEAYSYEEYLQRWGSHGEPVLPFEMTVTRTMLSKLERCLVLDSCLALTLPYLLRYLGLDQKIEIIGGIPTEAFPRWCAEKYVGQVAEFTRHYRATLDALMQPITSRTLDNTCWIAQLVPSKLDTALLDNEGLDSQKFIPQGQFTGAIIYVPDRDWLPFMLCLVDQLADEGMASILILPKKRPLSFTRPSAVFAVLDVEQLDHAVRFGGLSASRIYVHSFGFVQDTRQIKNLFPKALLCFYADGFKNELKMPNAWQGLAEIVYFGYQAHELPFNIRILSFDSWLQNIPKVYASSSGIDASIKADVLVCLRYYGIGPYRFEATQLVHLIWSTMQTVLSPGATLIIKGDRRHPALTEQVKAYITRLHDGKVLDLQDYLGDLAYQPVEAILQTPALSLVKSFVVFDSSLSYILAHHPAVRHDAVILLGASLDAILDQAVPDGRPVMPTHEEQIAQEQGRASRSFDAALKTIRYYSAWYARALEHEGFPVVKLGDALYCIRRSKCNDS